MASSTVIIGTGIIGVSTAYFLSQSPTTLPASIHLVEASPRLFASASGLAAGFLARDWFGPSTSALGALSFDLHREIAEKNGGREKWGYSPSTGTSFVEGRGGGGGTRGLGADAWLRHGASRAEAARGQREAAGQGPRWLTVRKGDGVEVISKGDTAAQIDPLRLCQWLLSECKLRGVQLHQPAKVLSISKDTTDALSSVRILSTSNGTETDIPCTRLVLTAGAWTPAVFTSLFPSSPLSIPVSPLAGHSLVVRSPRWAAEHEPEGCHAVFTTTSGFSPEIFSRVGGEIYVAGLNDASLKLPALPTDSKIDDESIAVMQEVATRLLALPDTDDLEVMRKGLCFRPVTPWGTPVLTRIEDGELGGGLKTRGGAEGGVFLCAGHGPWGISMSLGTGKVFAEVIEDKSPSVDIQGLGLS